MPQPEPPPATRDLPRVGALATVRNRRGVIAAVEPHAGDEGQVHLVSVEYLDPDGALEDLLVWEREPRYEVLEPTALPNVAAERPMHPRHLDALVRAARWSALRPFLDPDGSGPLERMPLAAPFYGGIQIEDFQLVPLLQALRMPRVTLLLADDVGLGKTIEAGLILAELIQRRRLRRALVLCPASLRRQWQQELWDKFSLAFEVVDREATERLRRRLGMDANPWRVHSHIIASYDYLKQADVMEEFRSAFPPDGTATLPWDMLIVDEVHNLAPATVGEDSDVSRMLQQLAPLFEHRLFLSATPHNGHTRSFTGLLECLDPVRFSQESRLTDPARRRAEEVVVRRLKREINERRAEQEAPIPFCERELSPVTLPLGPHERALSQSFAAFRARVRSLVAESRRGERLAGSFAIEVLKKRLLSCPVAFADTWRRYREGMASEEPARVEEVRAAERATREEQADDRELEGRTRHAATVVGAWLKPHAGRLTDEMAAVDEALVALGLAGEDPVSLNPVEDSRWEALVATIERHVRAGGRFPDDERIVVFTEFKTTLDYLERRLRARFPQEGRVRVLYGGMEGGDEREERDGVIASFNDPADPVRVLVATDAAAEGLNLQETARLLLHYDVPWNPARLEQRNGRLDRHGQARDVTVFHFVTDDDADLDFLAYVVGKVHTIREDLGSTGEVFDAALERRLILGEDAAPLKRTLDEQLEAAKGRAEVPRARGEDLGEAELDRLRALAADVDLDPETLRETLDLALGDGAAGLVGPDERGRFRVGHQVPAIWTALVEDTLRAPDRRGRTGAMRRVVFDPHRLVRDIGGRLVFRPEPDTVLLHLGHPLFHQALAWFARMRFPGAGGAVEKSRWTVRCGGVPAGADAMVLLTVEEMAVNELRETFHHWVRTVRLPVKGGALGEALPHLPARELRGGGDAPPEPDVRRARAQWEEVQPEVRGLIGRMAGRLTARLTEALAGEFELEKGREVERFQQRLGELSRLIEETTTLKLEREIEELRAEQAQGRLFDPERRVDEIESSIEEKEAEIRRRRSHYESLRAQLERERERVLKRLLPRRYALRGTAQVFPVAVEIRLPEGAE